MDYYRANPGVGQYVLGIILGTLAITAGGLSLTMNYAFGLQSSVIMAAIFVVSDLAKIILPITTAALGGWNAHRKTVYLVAVAISVLAAVSYLLQTQADRLIASNSESRLLAGANIDAKRIRRELGNISETMSAATLHRLVKEKQAAAEREAAREFCGPKCETLKAEHAQLLARLSQAERRGKLEQELLAIKQTVSVTKAEAVGASDTLAVLTGGNRERIATHEAIVKSVLMLIVLELLAALSGSAGTMIIRTWRARQVKPAETEAKPAEIALQPAEKSTKSKRNYWMERLSREHPAIAAEVLAGRISCYRGCINAGLRKQPAKQRNLAKIEAYHDEKATA